MYVSTYGVLKEERMKGLVGLAYVDSIEGARALVHDSWRPSNRDRTRARSCRCDQRTRRSCRCTQGHLVLTVLFVLFIFQSTHI